MKECSLDHGHKEAQKAKMSSQNPLCFLCLFVA